MKKRMISLLLVLVTLLGILPVTSFAAPTLEEAMAEVDIYARNETLDWLTMNGSVKEQHYTYYKYESVQTGQLKEIPAYCVDPRLYGVPALVPEGTPIKYTAPDTVSDPKVCGIIANGYPHESLSVLKVNTPEEAYYATKTALWIYLLGNWSVNGLGINPNADQAAAKRVLEATRTIYTRGMGWSSIPTPKLTATADKDVAYLVTINGQPYYQQVITISSDTWSIEDVKVSLADGAPAGARILDMNDQEITRVPMSTFTFADGHKGQCKIVYPATSVEGQTGTVQLNMRSVVVQYEIYYAKSLQADQYGNIQDYMLDTDPHLPVEGSFISRYSDSTEDFEEGETGIKIIKLETGTQIPLEGAVFKVTGPEGTTVGSFSTGQNGTVTIPVTQTGHYTVEELSPPKWHLISGNATQHVQAVHGKIAEVTFYNDPYGNLRVEKYSNTGDPLEGVTIQIKHIVSGETKSGQTGPGGAVQFTQLKPGGWEVRETAGIEGWIADTDTVKTVSVVSGETSTVTFTNKELPGLRIIKYDRTTLKVMTDILFEIWRDGESLGQYSTNQQGEILITNAQPGTYLAREVRSDDEHVTDTTPQQIELHAGDGIKDLVFFNGRKPGIHLVKVDSANLSKPIPNVKFSIRAVDGTFGPKEFTTNEDGEIDLSKLLPGAYEVLELECPGYVVDQAQRIIQLEADQNAEFVFTNSRLPSLHLLKTSSDGSPLAGVSFCLAKIENSSHYLDRITSSTGEILWEGLEPGVYSLIETATKNDHIIDLKEHHVELFPGKTSEIVLENHKRPNLTVYKRDADTGELVPNTIFTVRAADGHSVDEIKTGPDGKAELKNLLPGVYEISEKSVPSPWLMDAPSQLVTLYPDRDHTIYFENHKRPIIEIIKENAVTFEPLANVPFRVWYSSNHTSTGEINDLGTFYTDENGRIELNGPEMGELGLRDGWFRVQELEPLKGFAKADPDTQEAFVAAGQGHTFRFRNRPLSAICVWKYDSQHPNQAIEGAVFQIRYLSGNTSGTGGTVIGTFRTSANGSFTATGLKKGTYIIEELSSDGNHVIDTPPQSVYLSGEEQEVVQVYFGNSAKGALLVKKVSASDGAPLSDVEFFVTTSNGTVVGDANGKFVTDSAGTFLVEGIEPNTTLIVKETRAKSGYLLDDTPQTVQIKAGQTVTLEFRNKPLGNLIIHKLSSADKKTPLAGVQFKITYADGKVVDAEGGKLSSNGLYWTDKNGQIVLFGITGTLIVTEVASIDGYTIDPDTRTQTVVVNPDDTQELYFYNAPVKGLDLIKVSESDKTKRIPDVTFEIRRMDGALVDTITTDKQGRAHLDLEAGAYYAVEIDCPSNFKLDSTPHYFTIQDGKGTTLTVTNAPFSGIILHKIDSVTGEGIYDVKFLVYDQNKNPIGEYSTDNEGYIYIDDLTVQGKGKLFIRELEAAPGYELDKQYKTVYVQPGKTIEVEWENTPITGQFQIYKYAAEYNEVTGTPAGAPLQGAVYEISEARSGKVVDYITTDARGVAASKPLPLGRYKIVETTAPAYWQLSGKTFDETLEYSGQIIKISDYDKPSSLGVTITKRSNTGVLAGSQMRYDFTVANTSNVPLSEFYWHDRIPTDAARATVFTTGTYSARLNYRILYKTNYFGAYQVLASNLITSSNYSFSLNAIPTQAGEYVTDVYVDFGKVPVGFQSVVNPTLTVTVSGTAANGYQLINRADAGGKYQGTWQTAQTSWVTIIRKLISTIVPTLPKTGY